MWLPQAKHPRSSSGLSKHTSTNSTQSSNQESSKNNGNNLQRDNHIHNSQLLHRRLRLRNNKRPSQYHWRNPPQRRRPHPKDPSSHLSRQRHSLRPLRKPRRVRRLNLPRAPQGQAQSRKSNQAQSTAVPGLRRPKQSVQWRRPNQRLLVLQTPQPLLLHLSSRLLWQPRHR